MGTTFAPGLRSFHLHDFVGKILVSDIDTYVPISDILGSYIKPGKVWGMRDFPNIDSGTTIATLSAGDK
ncbi:hypothetical protein GCM10027287_30980 [Bordetella muralis]